MVEKLRHAVQADPHLLEPKGLPPAETLSNPPTRSSSPADDSSSPTNPLVHPLVAAVERVATALEKLADPPDDDFSGLVSLITVKVYRAWPDVPLPERAYPDSAGYDLVSAETIEVGFGENKTVSTGLMLEIPPGWYGRIQARSSTRSYVAPGIIDSDYRDTVKIGVYNHHSTIPVRIFAGQVIAQFTLHQETVINWQEVTSESALSITERGKRGFGSSDDDGK